MWCIGCGGWSCQLKAGSRKLESKGDTDTDADESSSRSCVGGDADVAGLGDVGFQWPVAALGWLAAVDRGGGIEHRVLPGAFLWRALGDPVFDVWTLQNECDACSLCHRHRLANAGSLEGAIRLRPPGMGGPGDLRDDALHALLDHPRSALSSLVRLAASRDSDPPHGGAGTIADYDGAVFPDSTGSISPGAVFADRYHTVVGPGSGPHSIALDGAGVERVMWSGRLPGARPQGGARGRACGRGGRGVMVASAGLVRELGALHASRCADHPVDRLAGDVGHDQDVEASVARA